MKNFKQLFLTIFIFAFGFFIVNQVFSYFTGYEKAKQQSYRHDKLIFTNLIHAQEENLKLLSDTLVLDDVVKKGYRENNPEIIKKHVMPIWEKVKDEKLTYEIHFFKPPAISFVNFSNFKSIGKDVSDVRTDIVWITSSFEPSFHPFMCKTYAGYRATTPIFDKNGTILGGLSLGKKIDWIPQFIKKRTKHNSFLVYTKKSTNTLMKKYYDDFVKDKQIIGDYILADPTIDIKPDLIKYIDFSKEIQKVTINGSEYSLNIYPIVDFNKHTMAYLCTIDNMDLFYKKYFESLFNNLLLVLLTAMIIFYFSRNKTLQILKKIDAISLLSEQIKKREFQKLHDLIQLKQSRKQNNSTALATLEDDIVTMGLEIEEKYTTLEDENQQKTKQLFEQIYTDELTQIANRNALFRDLQENENSFLVIFNIKSFKQINDVFGFDAGNSILQQISLLFTEITKEDSYKLYRIGSDEFVVLSGEKTTKDDFEIFVIKAIRTIEENNYYFEENKMDLVINLYAGISFGKNRKLEKADTALNIAKAQRKDYIIYTERKDTKDEQYKNLQMINQIRIALENDNIFPFYQAIVDSEGNKNKYEALIRMKNGSEILSPFAFLEISQKTKYYEQITRNVIIKTMRLFHERFEKVSINLTADDILNEQTLRLIDSELKKFSDPSRIIFEIVESESIYNVKEITEFIEKVKLSGAKIAIDDFGTGYSNFSYMMQIKPDYLKIDGSIIRNIDKDKNAAKIVKTIVTFANELGIKTIAEFVHSQEVFEVCKELGVDEFQGYYFSEPAELK